ncbi:hypothetical protein HDU97_006994 [Phlyctochytrium planicorne]|nr:hypothetical protein HDU97_006994 [Phlyctochytrium planicorne]
MSPPAINDQQAAQTITESLKNINLKDQTNAAVKPHRWVGRPGYPNLDHTTYPALEDHEYIDKALSADPTKSSLLSAVTKRTDLTVAIGTELEGVQLSKLNEQQKNELALLIAERGVVFVRDQDIEIEDLLEFGRHYGRLHIHQTTGHPEGLPEVHVVYANGKSPSHPLRDIVKTENSTTEIDREGDQVSEYLKDLSAKDLWHTDVSYERQPPSYTFLKIDYLPDVGGDTLWSSSVASYEKLSPAFQKFLEGLTAIHSGVRQAEESKKRGGPNRREPIETEHPVVRTHPVTGKKAIYVNPVFTTRIKNLNKHESDLILNYLYNHIQTGVDFQVRFKWSKNSIAIWDNRITNHAATFDFGKQIRHGQRVTPQGEKPFFDPNYVAPHAAAKTA